MAAKRLFEESGTDHPEYQPNHRQARATPSFASVIREVITGNLQQNFCSALEPMLRRVVNEEVENGLQRYTRSLTGSRSLQIQHSSLEPPALKLIFTKNPSISIFTGTKILDVDKNPLQILVVDARSDQMIPTTLSSPIKVEIVVVDGDFPIGDCEMWTSEEFDRNIVRERAGKRPLLAGDNLHFTMREGFALLGDIEFTDNSSWIRSRKFRLGARVIQGTSQGVKIKEAMTQPFVVKDHRGELYKKHHPPMLEDEVWRLEKIGKDGVFHKKLNSHGIHSVQDFLKLSIVNLSKLKKIFGGAMSEKVWEVMLKHARTCSVGSKLYIFRGPNHNIILNPICQVVKAEINGQTYTNQDLTSVNKAYIENLVREAYSNWSSLEEIDGLINQTPLTQGELVDQCGNHRQTSITTYQQHSFLTDASMEVPPPLQNNNWGLNSAYISTHSESGLRYNFPDYSSSDGDMTPQ